MEDDNTTCPGCGVSSSPVAVPPYDGYYNTTPGCFAIFTQVCGREFGNAIVFGAVHQLTVDAYALQHAGGPHPDKSIDVHLCGLYLVYERGFKPTSVAPLLQRIATASTHWPHFDPPADQGPLTISDVYANESPGAHIILAETWSRQVWMAWRQHHVAIGNLIDAHPVASR